MREEPSVGVRLLGPVDVRVAGRAPRLSGLRRKAVLAVLALHRGEPVGSERLVDIVWGPNPPASVASALQNTVSYLRGLLGDRSRIPNGAGGYRLSLPPGAIDLERAESLIRARTTDADPRERVTRLRTALGLWRGESLADVADVDWLAEQARQLEQLRATAGVSLIDARMALGEHADVVLELQQAAQTHPYREDLYRQLILALYRCGRQADALAAYQRLRDAMRDELGIEPGPALRDLEVAVLRQDPALDLVVPITASAPAPRPAQLPHAPRTFAARTVELARLDETTSGLTVISGTAGVGKTTLAVHWANRAADAYPDGQLYVNLRGFDPGGQARPSDVLRGFLRALGVAVRDIPATVEEQIALYRTTMTGRRILVLLDNARDEDQVRPLLPGGTDALILVTSRNRLTGLVVAEGARAVPLKRPSAADARQILHRRLGPRRMAAAPGVVDDIIARCARLPLALAVAAAHAATDPSLSLAAVAGQLSEGLDSFPGGDPATDVRAVFSWSYRALSAPAAELFRLLGVFPAAPDFSLAGLASLAGLTPRQTRPLVAELVRNHLLSEISPGRYGCHDLLRAFAFSLGPEGDALARLLEHYLHTAYAAKCLYQPPRDPITLAPARPGVHLADLPGTAEAAAWFARELPALLAAVRLDPPESGWRPWQLAWTVSVHLERQGRWSDYAAVHQAGLAAADRADDRIGQAYAHFFLSRAARHRNREDDCHDHRDRAIALFRELGDPIGEAGVHLDRASADQADGRTADVLAHASRALELYRSAGFRSGIGHALSDLAWMHLSHDNLAEVRDLAEQGLALHLENGDGRAQADTWDTLGSLHIRQGDLRRGVECYERAILLYHQLADPYNEADSLTALATDLAGAGAAAEAHQAQLRATALLPHLARSESSRIRQKVSTVELLTMELSTQSR
ncbi:DNA-binding SARP family transcriptional activator [Actinoplanes tereljensis]|uniref:SARP family transcriptional regulator n=1 Tax=Paractinoplanes tereljensis TaxID=571912 RepID=A0A919NQA9_9ACTN|nr:transcriptional regulator [Actinoplanes tereljensis]GIF23131.1 SARP family transcriptional regulator [Actinoplanes tereljensis]